MYTGRLELTHTINSKHSETMISETMISITLQTAIRINHMLTKKKKDETRVPCIKT